jgi:hypothetical protein
MVQTKLATIVRRRTVVLVCSGLEKLRGKVFIFSPSDSLMVRPDDRKAAQSCQTAENARSLSTDYADYADYTDQNGRVVKSPYENSR